ncbi:hypothetical protein P3102_20645 [Amycolatopsis sp. QT-25]|uniref:hypothetical protein n=1 Tax=Amycolatopsis sp. QT-25 TaxID=3034022 RepID=UPI0023EB52C5|nr:hypothetical protein [Amycolatopsis sp. QT-25]WET76535.1 hypothetical protein P3102_20645 [Amycolatopsis sp. QT-25]
MYGAAFAEEPVWIFRWSLEPDMWSELLRRNGFGNIRTRLETALKSGEPATLIVEAELRAGSARVVADG